MSRQSIRCKTTGREVPVPVYSTGFRWGAWMILSSFLLPFALNLLHHHPHAVRQPGGAETELDIQCALCDHYIAGKSEKQQILPKSKIYVISELSFPLVSQIDPASPVSGIYLRAPPHAAINLPVSV